MKTITPLKITADEKSLIGSAKKAINNATINDIVVNFIVGKLSFLVYPYEKVENVLKDVQIGILQDKIAKLS
jgi:hypothetical protein